MRRRRENYRRNSQALGAIANSATNERGSSSSSSDVTVINRNKLDSKVRFFLFLS